MILQRNSSNVNLKRLGWELKLEPLPIVRPGRLLGKCGLTERLGLTNMLPMGAS
jgi:hypothetical protein